MTTFESLTDRYLWASSPAVAQIPPGELVQSRYQVVAPQIWVDTQPALPPSIPEQMPNEVISYLRLYPWRLHIPEVYGICSLDKLVPPTQALLLENVPIDSKGKLMPGILAAWTQASPVRQVYWLWQLFELWNPLWALGVASSLLMADNIRVDEWRVRLLQLYPDPLIEPELELAVTEVGENHLADPNDPLSSMMNFEADSPETPQLGLQHLGDSWMGLCRIAHASVAGPLQEICNQMQQGATEQEIAHKLNQLLLEEASLLPLRLRVAGATDTGPTRSHNEDTCYPTAEDLPADYTQPTDPLIPHLTLVCDGIGGHEGGEVASQLAVQSLKLQIRALLAEVTAQNELATPELMKEQLTAIIRVVNNMIAARNDEQGRESRRRMGTTLVMALQLPQQIHTSEGFGNTHELYIASVGDSRAYWITPHSCQQLTIDDDVATREARMGRSLYREALRRPDAGALTQALGTRDAEFLRPHVQRFIVEEDGLLLLCSDGLSDNNWVEQSWAEYVQPVLQGQIPLDAVVKSWIDLANQKNGHDNTSIVITYCRVSPEYPVLLNLGDRTEQNVLTQVSLQPELSQSVNYSESTSSETPVVTPVPKRQLKVLVGVLTGLVLLLAAGAVGVVTWWTLDPKGFGQTRTRLQKSWEQQVPSQTLPSPSPLPQNSPVPSPSVSPSLQETQ